MFQAHKIQAQADIVKGLNKIVGKQKLDCHQENLRIKEMPIFLVTQRSGHWVDTVTGSLLPKFKDILKCHDVQFLAWKLVSKPCLAPKADFIE